MAKTALELEERFWSKVARAGDDDCWLWTASIDGRGYGQFGIGRGEDGKFHNARAHRVAWELTNGPIPDGMNACHRCDVRRCCNPKHVFIGTQRENMDDMVSKCRTKKGPLHWTRHKPERIASGDRNGSRRHRDRLRRGDQSPRAKLTAAIVLEIRADYASGRMSQGALARRHGVTQGAIWAVIHRVTWQEVSTESTTTAIVLARKEPGHG